MKIVTINLWGTYGPYAERRKLFLEELGRLRPDILCLQEITDPNLAAEIQMKIALPSAAENYDAGLAILTRFPILSERILKYAAVSPNETNDRRAVIVELEIGNINLVVANTHLSWKAEDGMIRLAQVRELLGAVSKTKSPALLAGDFNDVPQSPAVQEIKKSGFVDLFELIHPDEAGLTWDNQNPFIQSHNVKFPDRRIDFLFAGGGRKRGQVVSEDLSPFPQGSVKSCKVVFNRPDARSLYPSDHYGLLAELIV
jgi:endonuclease/exonuclease/phosphatase family metal-dependent hydrolase